VKEPSMRVKIFQIVQKYTQKTTYMYVTGSAKRGLIVVPTSN